MAETFNGEPGSKHPWLVFAVAALALLMSSIDATIIAVGLPTMIRELNTNLVWIGWTLTGYALVMTTVLPMAGKLSDDVGRKRLFLAAVAVFTASSLAAGLSSSVHALIISRVLQGLGGGAFMPSATGIVSDAFGSKRAAAIGLFSSILPLGGVLGPNIGGLIIDHLSWRWIFFVNVPIGMALMVFGWFILPASKPSATRHKIDLLGAGLFAGSILFILYAMTVWGNEPSGMGGPMIWTLLALGGLMLGVFIWHEGRTASPMMESKLLTWRPFLAANAYNLLHGACVFAFFSFVPYFATVVYGMGASESGIVLTPRSIAMAAMSTISSFFLLRFGYRRPMIIGTVLMSLSLLLTSAGIHDATFAGLQVPNLALMAAFVLLGGLGGGLTAPAGANAALDLLPGQVAAVAGIRAMFRHIGGVLGTAIVVLALSRFEDKAAGAMTVFFYMSFALLAVVPIIFFIPDIARQRRQAETETAQGQARLPAPSRSDE
ncbi:MAG: MFS transporter [Chloroflexi bacterium]|nr:MFS transporter [Chloroflexota bacterium]